MRVPNTLSSTVRGCPYPNVGAPSNDVPRTALSRSCKLLNRVDKIVVGI